jgi:hypothetical protein
MEKNEIATKSQNALQNFNLNETLPDLTRAKVINADLTSEYWTPSTLGEEKRCFFQSIEPSTYTDEKTGEAIELPCVIVIAQDEKGNVKTIRNGSRRLVACIEDAFNVGTIAKGTPLVITYNGKEKNKSNSYMSDRWSVKPLFVN